MNLWPFGRRAPQKLEKTAQAEPVKPPGDGMSVLRTQWVSRIYSQVIDIIGQFNPKAVSTSSRLLMRYDPDVAFGDAALRAPLINAQYSVDGNDDKIKSFVEAEFKKHFRAIARSASLAIGLGYQVTEKIWKAGPTNVEIEDKTGGVTQTVKLPMAWTFDRFKTIDPRMIVLHVDEKTDEWDGVHQYMLLGNQIPNPTDLVGPERVALWTHGKEDNFNRLTGFAMYNVAYSDWWDKSAISLYANRYFETKGDPALIGRAILDSVLDANGDRVDGYSLVGGVLKLLKGGNAVVLPSDRDDKGNFKYDVDFLKDDKRGDLFESYLKYKSGQILQALKTPPRVGGAHAGSGLGTKDAGVQQDQHSEFLESVLYDFFDYLNEQYVKPLVIYNFGVEAWEQSKTRLTPAGISSGMKMLLRDILFKAFDEEMTLGSGTSIPLYKRMDAPAIMKTLDVPMPSPDDFAELEAEQAKTNAEAKKMQDAANGAGAAPPLGGGNGHRPPPEPDNTNLDRFTFGRESNELP